MRILSLSLSLSLALARPTLAEDATWDFRKGTVYTYEASSILEWSLDAKPGADGRPKSAKQRQEEDVTLRLEILSIDDQGNAAIEGTFPAVKVENTAFNKVSWDSEKSKSSEFLGFKRYETLRTLKFTATVSPRGRVLTSSNAGTPDRAPTPNTAKEHVEAAALAMHNPTTPRAWLELIFGAVPPVKKKTPRTIRFIEEESLEVSFDRNEQQEGRACAKLSFETPDRAASIPEKDVSGASTSDPNAIAWAAVRAGRKKGEAWFDRKNRCVAKFEAECDVSIAWGPGSTSARMTWKAELKKHDVKK
ncbi:MAG: hypothetical protein FD180_3216 [Planctomycetota bacterium]|nr:MAG: hypothetical protein FD180_3216 [Planctomycetota bacterium]